MDNFSLVIYLPEHRECQPVHISPKTADVLRQRFGQHVNSTCHQVGGSSSARQQEVCESGAHLACQRLRDDRRSMEGGSGKLSAIQSYINQLSGDLRMGKPREKSKIPCLHGRLAMHIKVDGLA